jgi:segregation and condensation protein A
MTEVRAGDSYRVELPEFEGPLDLLLHLCKTHEIDIVKLPIAFVTEKYLEYLDVMQTLSVDVAADYLVMAATLAYLKSRELVPAPEPLEATEEEGGEEVLDPREELIRRLLEYQKYKNAAALLGERPIEGRNIFGRGMEIEGDAAPTPLSDHSVWKLIEAFGRLLEKAGPKVNHEVAFDRISIGSRINQLIDKLELKRGAMRFEDLFDLSLSEPELRGQLVVTLLAILELARLKVLRVLASEEDGTLFIAQVEGAALEEARRAKLTSDSESIEALAAGEEVAETVVPETAGETGDDAVGAFDDEVATTAAGKTVDEAAAAFDDEVVTTAVGETVDEAAAAFDDEVVTTTAGEAVDEALAAFDDEVVTRPGDEVVTKPGDEVVVPATDAAPAVQPAAQPAVPDSQENHEET